ALIHNHHNDGLQEEQLDAFRAGSVGNHVVASRFQEKLSKFEPGFFVVNAKDFGGIAFHRLEPEHSSSKFYQKLRSRLDLRRARKAPRAQRMRPDRWPRY